MYTCSTSLLKFLIVYAIVNAIIRFESIDLIRLLQVLVVGDSITRGISWKGFEVLPHPGITAEKLRNKVRTCFILFFCFYHS